MADRLATDQQALQPHDSLHEQHTLPLRNVVYVFGSGASGRLGLGNQEHQHLPRVLASPCPITCCVAGGSHSLFLTGAYATPRDCLAATANRLALLHGSLACRRWQRSEMRWLRAHAREQTLVYAANKACVPAQHAPESTEHHGFRCARLPRRATRSTT
jgi:hypothetical protein